MIDTKEFVDKLIEKGVTEVVGVPCSTMTPLINELSNRGLYTPYVNEGSAVAYAAGRNLHGITTAVIMQNSGLTNASSPISSLTSLYNIPMLYLVGYRGGDPYEHDEPQHQVLGPATLRFIECITKKESRRIMDLVCVNDLDYVDETAQNFLLVRKSTFSSVSSLSEASSERKGFVSRLSLIKSIKDFAHQHPDVYILSTTGYTSRELMSLGEVDSHNFYMFGSMGCLISFADGVADIYPDKKFIVLDGDGSALMRLESSVEDSIKSHPNILRVVCDNECHLSTGGQSLCLYSQTLDDTLNAIYRDTVPLFCDSDTREFEIYLLDWYQGKLSKSTCIVNVSEETLPNLPRPQETPETLLNIFKAGLCQ